MTRGNEDIERGGVAPKIFRHPKGGLFKNYWTRRVGETSKPTEGGVLKN